MIFLPSDPVLLSYFPKDPFILVLTDGSLIFAFYPFGKLSVYFLHDGKFFFFLQTHSVETPYGSVTFTVYGTPKPKRPAIFTYHDVGLNCKTFISFPTSFWEETGEGTPV